ncbi:MAG: EFR1 family ferrodoxin [Clostridia bacterium]|nr:EFR1 family ferrodoxin [Clostridia bacterium]
MKTTIYYFSGTGNTLKVAEILKTKLTSLGVNVELKDITKDSTPTPSDTIIIAYPVYGFNPPKNVIDFVRALPEDVIKVYFLKTSGEPLRLNDASSLTLKRTLERKGYVVCGEYHYVMPYNMIFKHTDALASKMLLTASERLKTAAQEIASGRRRHILMPLRARVMRAVCRIEHKGMALNGRLYKVNENKCINCGKCLKNCPTKNVTYQNGKFHFSGNCLGCARCAFNCPTDAISTGLLNCLKVNGPYDFNANPDDAKLPKFCHRSYKKYFYIENAYERYYN